MARYLPAGMLRPPAAPPQKRRARMGGEMGSVVTAALVLAGVTMLAVRNRRGDIYAWGAIMMAACGVVVAVFTWLW